MQKSGVCNTRCQLFFKEVGKREHALRTKWFVLNKQRLIDNLKSDKFIRKARAIIQDEEAIKKNKREENKLLIENYRRRKDLIYPEWRPKIDDNVSIDYMKPIKPEVKSILYEKNARSFDAKNKYLKERYKDLPEDRYFYPDCNSWVYGWRLKDFIK